jgi:membrane associated rhomboid family serine protease
MDFFGQRSPDEGWFRVGTFEVTTTVFIAAASTISMFLWALDTRLVEPLVLWASDVWSGQIWRLVTWPLANEPSIWTAISIALFYLFGREVERSLGRRRFVWFVGYVVLVPAVVAVLLSLNNAGLFSVTTALFLTFIAAYPTARGFFGIPLWIFGVVFVGIDILQLIGLRDFDRLVLVLVGCAIALVAARAFGLSELEWIPRVPLPGSGASPRPVRPRRTARSPRRGHAEVVPLRPPTDPRQEAEIDALLDKISESGLDSLTPEERRRLDEHSRRMRGER